MLRRLNRAILAVASLAILSIGRPSTAAAQVAFQSCSAPGVCGWVQALLTGTNLSVRLTNTDATFGSALFRASITFSNTLGTTPGTAFNVSPIATVSGSVNQYGTTFPNSSAGWSYGGIGGSNQLDLASFFGIYVEGTAPSIYRAGADGTFETTTNPLSSYVQFDADLSSIAGVSGSTITDLGFETDQGFAGGAVSTVTPEPASLLLFATGLAAVGFVVPRRRRLKR